MERSRGFATRPRKLAKDPDSSRFALRGLLPLRPLTGRKEDDMANKKTCAACDYELDANAISVTVGGKTVEVCCQECADKLKEAHASAARRA